MNDRTQLANARESKGFTVIELIISIAVIAVLIGLIVIGVQAVKKRAGGLLDASSVDQVFTAVKQFKQEVGFLPPMVKEFAAGGPPVDQMIVRQTALPWAAIFVPEPADPPRHPDARFRIAVYTRGSNANFFKGNDPAYAGPVPTNFLQDNRFSQLTLGYYLAGQLEFGYNATYTDVPVDGVSGPGMYKPEKGGFFDVPDSMLKPVADRKRQGKTYGPYVEAAGKSVKVETDIASDSSGRDVTVRDRNGVPIRYYYWLPSTTGNDPDPDRNMLLPRMVCRLPDDATHQLGDPIVPDQLNPKTNTVLRNASWAIVAAGPDKVFGDEEINHIAQVLGKTPPGPNVDEDRKLRLLAARDNIVRLGTED